MAGDEVHGVEGSAGKAFRVVVERPAILSFEYLYSAYVTHQQNAPPVYYKGCK